MKMKCVTTYIQKKGILSELESYFSEYSHPILLVDSFILKQYPHFFVSLQSFIYPQALPTNVDCVVGIGGGRIMDEAKHLAYQMNCDCLLAPTSPATDAPCTNVCVVKGNYIKCGFPQKVLVDEEILIEAPTRFLKSGIGDALSTYFESVHYEMTPEIQKDSLDCLQNLLLFSKQALLDQENHVFSDALSTCWHTILYTSGTVYAHTGGSLAHQLASVLQKHNPTLMHGELVAYALLVQLVLENNNHFTEIASLIHDIQLLSSFPTFDCSINSHLYNEIKTMLFSSHSYSISDVIDAIQTVNFTLKTHDYSLIIS